MTFDSERPPHSPRAATPADFRAAASQFATGITVVTAEDDGDIQGMTCNSFTSISLEPPTILVSLKPGNTHRAVRATGRFGVSVLQAEHQAYSAYFAGAGDTESRPTLIRRQLVPTLRDSLAWFECSVESCVEIHDHTLFVGRVRTCGARQGSPLIFYSSRYHRHLQPSVTTFAGRAPERRPPWQTQPGVGNRSGHGC